MLSAPNSLVLAVMQQLRSVCSLKCNPYNHLRQCDLPDNLCAGGTVFFAIFIVENKLNHPPSARLGLFRKPQPREAPGHMKGAFKCRHPRQSGSISTITAIQVDAPRRAG